MQKLDPRSIWLFFFRYIWATIIIVATLSVSLLVGFAENDPNSINSGVILAVILIIIAAFALDYLIAWLTYKTYSYELADNAFKRESGIIMRRSTTIPYDRIQNVDIIRSLWARIMGLSDLNIQTAGGSAYAGLSEGRLTGLSKETALQLQDELLKRAKVDKSDSSV